MKRKLQSLAKIAGLSVVAGHLALTVAFNLPDNPLKQRMTPVLDATIGTYFSQNWRLFAPTPASSDVSLVVGCATAREFDALAARHQAGEDVGFEGPWVDITAPLWSRHQQARLSAYDRISRAQANAGRAYLQGPVGVETWWKACEKGEPGVCERLDQVLRGFRLQQTAEMVRVGSSYCRSRSDDVAGVALRVRERKAIPWSERFAGIEPEVTEVYLGIYPPDHTVALAPVYRES